MADRRRQSGGGRISNLSFTDQVLTSRMMQMTASRFDLVIFDCDSVLVDSESIISQAQADALTQCGYAVTAQDLIDRFCGMTDPESFSSRAPQRCGSPTRIRATRRGEPRHSLRSAMPFPVRPKGARFAP